MNGSRNLEQPRFLEKWWLPPIYACSAAFVLDGTALTPEGITGDLQPLYVTARMQDATGPKVAPSPHSILPCAGLLCFVIFVCDC
jgi:hypothetical protein